MSSGWHLLGSSQGETHASTTRAGRLSKGANVNESATSSELLAAPHEETTIYLVRHGQVHNPDRILYGRLPGFRLSDAGQRQARMLVDHFRDIPLAAIIASPLQRAQETALPLAQTHGLTVQSDDRLLEAENFLEGTQGPNARWILLHPRVWHLMRNWRLPTWGEPHRNVAERMRAAIDDARTRYPGQHVVLVSHQAPIWTARRSYEGWSLAHSPAHRECALASVTALRFPSRSGAPMIAYDEPCAAALPGPAGKWRGPWSDGAPRPGKASVANRLARAAADVAVVGAGAAADAAMAGAGAAAERLRAWRRRSSS